MDRYVDQFEANLLISFLDQLLEEIPSLKHFYQPLSLSFFVIDEPPN